jgi:hypothetical protein
MRGRRPGTPYERRSDSLTTARLKSEFQHEKGERRNRGIAVQQIVCGSSKLTRYGSFSSSSQLRDSVASVGNVADISSLRKNSSISELFSRCQVPATRVLAVVSVPKDRQMSVHQHII